MLTDYFGGYVSPPTIASNVHNYTPDGLVVWTNFNFPTMKFVRRGYNEEVAAIQAAIKDPNQAVLLQVDNGQHWVVAIRHALIGGDWLVADPWTGKQCWAKQVYHNVTGTAFFARK